LIVVQGYVFYVSRSDRGGISYSGIVRRRLGSRGESRKIAPNRPLVGDTLVSLGDYVYWVEEGRYGTFIARASLDGGSIDTRFRRVPDRGCHSHSEMHGGAISSRYYFIGCEAGGIDRITMTGRPRVRRLSTGGTVGSGPVLAATPE
jgi:hypothetical protein